MLGVFSLTSPKHSFNQPVIKSPVTEKNRKENTGVIKQERLWLYQMQFESCIISPFGLAHGSQSSDLYYTVYSNNGGFVNCFARQFIKFLILSR